jgi:TolB protein
MTVTASGQEARNPSHVRSKISVYDLATKSVRVVFTADELWEAPNWMPEGKYLLANSRGALFRIPINGGSPEKVPLDPAYACNNDHGISPDGKQIAISADHGHAKGSQVFLTTMDGAVPKLVTEDAPSYFHGWSPDGQWLAFVGQRGGHYNIFRIKRTGGAEERLTSAPAYDDGPDYSPDGKWIYINTDRSGSWDIWRFPAEGAGTNDSQAERVTNDALEDWFPHPSPDGKWLVFLSFPHGTKGHDVKTKIQLRMIPMPAAQPGVSPAKPEMLTEFFGGQGTINVNSWSPDSKQFAFVTYEILP